MGNRARVLASEALKDFRAALADFADDVTRALGSVESEVQRMSWWLSHERPAHWRAEVRRREDKVSRAKAEIARKQLIAAPEPASVVEERKALERAERDLASAVARQEATRKWAAAWDHEASVYKGSCAGLGEIIGRDVPRAMERLSRLADLIEEYERIAPPETDAAGPPVGTDLAAGLDGAPQPAVLRSLIPCPPDAALPGPFPLFAPDKAPLPDQDRAALGRLAISTDPPGPDELIAVQRLSLSAPEFALLRRPDPIPGSSGWEVASPGTPPGLAGDWVLVTVGEFLRHRPSLREALALARGTLLIASRGQVRRVLDAHDRDLWSQGGRP